MESKAPVPSYKLSQRLALAVLPPLAALVIRLWARSWRVRLAAPRDLDPRWCQERYIYAFWHESVLTIIPHWRDCQIQGLASQSFDGALIARLMQHLGFPALARGSSSRGGGSALKAHVDGLAQGLHVAISVDGPRGPRYQAKAGVLQLAALSGRPIVPVACVTAPNGRLRNWDQTQLPPPFARVAFVLGPPLNVQAGDEGAAQARLEAAMMQGLADAGALLKDS